MQRDVVIQRLRALMPLLRAHGVRSLTLFGSTARDQMKADSDVDVVVDLGPEPTYDALFAVHALLTQRLECSVDALTPGGIPPRLRAHIDREGILVA